MPYCCTIYVTNARAIYCANIITIYITISFFPNRDAFRKSNIFSTYGNTNGIPFNKYPFNSPLTITYVVSSDKQSK